jgi:hypothetical protein
MFGSGYENCLEFQVVLFLSLIFCKREEKLLFFMSVSGYTCLILVQQLNKITKSDDNINCPIMKCLKIGSVLLYHTKYHGWYNIFIP